MFCIIITEIWWNISNFYMAHGWSAFLWIFQKNCIINISLKSQERQRPKNFWITTKTIKGKQGPPLFFHSDTNLVLSHAVVQSVDKIHVLVVTVELTWLLFLNILSFNFFSTSNKSLRFRRFRRSYINCHVVFPTKHCQSCTALPFFLFFCSCLFPIIVHWLILFLLSTTVARMVLTPRWVNRRKDVK